MKGLNTPMGEILHFVQNDKLSSYKTTMKLDAVYTWVDPTNTEWISERNQYVQHKSPRGSSTDFSRYQSFDEIKYSLRSLCKYCDFINRVFIVSNNGSRPKWLNRNPDIVVVDDRSIFPNGGLIPNYNSNAIESCLHRIPGLSKYFLYLNDDFFITQPLSLNDLVDPSTRQWSVFMETDPIVKLYNQTLSSFLPEIRYLGGGAAKARRYTYQRLGLDCIHQIPIGHCPRIYDKDLIEEFAKVYSREIDGTRNQRFRTAESFCFCDAYAFHYGRLKKAKLKYDHQTKLIIFTDNAIVNHLQMSHALKNLAQYHFLAILDVRTKTNSENIHSIQHFLQRVFPDKSNFEL